MVLRRLIALLLGGGLLAAAVYIGLAQFALFSEGQNVGKLAAFMMAMMGGGGVILLAFAAFPDGLPTGRRPQNGPNYR